MDFYPICTCDTKNCSHHWNRLWSAYFGTNVGIAMQQHCYDLNLNTLKGSWGEEFAHNVALFRGRV